MSRLLFVGSLLVLALLTGGAHAQGFSPSLYERKPKDRIAFALYTVHDRTLKLTAQFYPLSDHEPFEARLQVRENDAWRNVATARIGYPGFAATFRVDDWDDRSTLEYRVAHNRTAFYRGTIRKNPQDKDAFVLAALSCNSVRPNHGGDLSKQDIVDNLKAIDPDLLFFAGDQVYDHSRHYLYWLRFGHDFGELMRDRPTVCLPDDHDVGQANLWGAGGIPCEKRDGQAGGYYMSPEYVKEVERAQTSHLPDPVDPTPIEQGIGVYYTHLKWGGMSFAILEDRKFKSGPLQFMRGRQGRPDSITEPGYDKRGLDSPDAVLLGDRQLRFLEEWVTDWEGAQMKCVLSQTPFAQACNYSGQHERQLYADFDSNGWPQTGRDKALRLIRKGFACHVAGDQHLATTLQHGIDGWRDAPYSFASPAIANYWTRWWDPDEPGQNRAPGAPDYTGDFLDGFGNRMTMLAAANPTDADRAADGDKLSTRAAGYGVVRFDKAARTTTFECWPRNVDITDPDSKQYPGWPITFNQADNYPQAGLPRLPKLQLSKPGQVVTVHDQATGEVVSSLRVLGETYQPATPREGLYRIEIGEGNDRRSLRSVRSSSPNRDSIDLAADARSLQ
ncbi:PhoD-like phosphatase [Planctomycetes bacterium MalM25]|nr:PhoD-like phosphatase [Planctomycetes bacterium MalM25]